jgi:AmmeMemoRadiSam system protein A
MPVQGVLFSPHPPILVPDIGRGEEKGAQKTLDGMECLASEAAKLAPEVIVCITPHGPVFQDGLCVMRGESLTGDFGQFGRPRVGMSLPLDQTLTDAFTSLLDDAGIPYVGMDDDTAGQYRLKRALDHGCLVPLYFIREKYEDFKIVHITIGLLPLAEMYAAGRLLAEAVGETGARAVILASGDMSHCLSDRGPYHYHPKGEVFDRKVEEIIASGELTKLAQIPVSLYEPAGQCGLPSFVMGVGTLDGYRVQTTVFSYEGPFGVGYLTGIARPVEEKAESGLKKIKQARDTAYRERTDGEDAYIALARRTIKAWVCEHKKPSWTEEKAFVDDELALARMDGERAGAFVSLHRGGQLRGCIGTIAPTRRTLGEEIMMNAIEACARDPRFSPVRESELSDLDVKVDILHPFEPIDSMKELDPYKYGVIVESRGRRGLLLPNLEGVDTVEEQVSIARRKAGIGEGERVTLYRFEVERHEV